MGISDTYGHARRSPQPGRNTSRDRRNEAHRTFPRNNRHNQRGVNCAVGEAVGGENDNEEYPDGDRDNSDYQWNRSQIKVSFSENGDSDFPIGLEFDDIGGSHTDSDMEAYLVKNRATEEYRDAQRSGDCDVFITVAKTNLARKLNGENARAIHRFGGDLIVIQKFKSSRERRDFVRTAVEISQMEDILELRKRNVSTWWVITSVERLSSNRQGRPRVLSAGILLTYGQISKFT